MNSKNKILFVSYYYPPIKDVGSLRTKYFSKYSIDNGWKAIVLTSLNPDKTLCEIGREKPPSSVEVYRVRSIANIYKICGKSNGIITRILKILGITYKKNIFKEFVVIPDFFLFWIPLAYFKAKKIIKDKKIKLIFVSVKPFSSSFVGYLLKKKLGIIFVLDIRDPISRNVWPESLKMKPSFRQSVIEKMEKKILQSADWVTFTSKETEHSYLSNYFFLSKKTSVIYNGFNETFENSVKISLLDAVPQITNDRCFRIVYVGDFYSNLIAPDPFFQGLKNFIIKCKLTTVDVQFCYAGSKHDWLDRIISDYSLGHFVKIYDRIPSREVVNLLKKSSMMLLRTVPSMISTKLYEGLALGIPIFAITPSKEVEKLLKDYGGIIELCKENNPETIARHLCNAYDLYKANKLKIVINDTYLNNFNKKACSKKFYELAVKLLNNNAWLPEMVDCPKKGDCIVK